MNKIENYIKLLKKIQNGGANEIMKIQALKEFANLIKTKPDVLTDSAKRTKEVEKIVEDITKEKEGDSIFNDVVNIVDSFFEPRSPPFKIEFLITKINEIGAADPTLKVEADGAIAAINGKSTADEAATSAAASSSGAAASSPAAAPGETAESVLAQFSISSLYRRKKDNILFKLISVELIDESDADADAKMTRAADDEAKRAEITANPGDAKRGTDTVKPVDDGAKRGTATVNPVADPTKKGTGGGRNIFQYSLDSRRYIGGVQKIKATLEEVTNKTLNTETFLNKEDFDSKYELYVQMYENDPLPQHLFYDVSVSRMGPNNRDIHLGSTRASKNQTINDVLNSVKGGNQSKRCIITSYNNFVNSIGSKDYFVSFNNLRLKHGKVELYLI